MGIDDIFFSEKGIVAYIVLNPVIMLGAARLGSYAAGEPLTYRDMEVATFIGLANGIGTTIVLDCCAEEIDKGLDNIIAYPKTCFYLFEQQMQKRRQ